MMKVILNWFVAAIAIVITAYVLPGVMVSGFFAAFVTAVILGLINAFLRPLIILLTLSINILTLGLLTFVINAFLIMLTDVIVAGFDVANFWWAMLFSLVLALVNLALGRIGNQGPVRPRPPHIPNRTHVNR